MFTKINKVLLWLIIVGGIITSIAIGSATDHLGNNNMGWFIPVGIIATFVLAAGFGMMIEISENIKKSCDFLYEIKSKTGGSYGANNTQQPIGTNPNYGTEYQNPSTENKGYGNALSKFSAINNGGSAATAPDFWYCTECGEKTIVWQARARAAGSINKQFQSV